MLALLVGLGVASIASADEPAVPTTPAYVTTVRYGIEKLVANDPAGAAEALFEAIAIDANPPDAHYYLGIALRMQGDVERALEELQSAATRSATAQQPRILGSALL
jgi:Tfp pilus assembly protein PilF